MKTYKIILFGAALITALYIKKAPKEWTTRMNPSNGSAESREGAFKN